MPGTYAVNARFLSHRVTGVERYAREISRRLGVKAREIRPARGSTGLTGHIWEQVGLPLSLKRDEVLWSPANSGPLLVTRQVVTIHDAFVFDHPEGFQPIFRAWYRVLLPRLAHRARQVITDSAYSRRRLSANLGISEERITVVHPGVDHTFFSSPSPDRIESTRKKYRLNKIYVLFVGSLEPRKNLINLFKTWETINKTFPGVDLAIVGGRVPRVHSKEFVHQPAHVRLLGYVPDEDLPALYSGAACFVLPSLDEGAGLPALEAAACGTPLLISNTGGLPEILAEAPHYVNPRNPEEIAAGMAAILSDSSLRRRLSIAAKARAVEMSWESTTAGVLQALEESSVH